MTKKLELMIGVDQRNEDQTAICLRVGAEIHIIRDPFASLLAERLMLPVLVPKAGGA